MCIRDRFLPAQAGEVVLYSSNNVETVNRVVDQFTKENPDVKVSVVRAGTGALMQRIKAEAANPLGDIFWSGGLSTIGEFQEYLQPYDSPQASAVAPAYRGEGGRWLGTNTHAVSYTHLRMVGREQHLAAERHRRGQRMALREIGELLHRARVPARALSIIHI